MKFMEVYKSFDPSKKVPFANYLSTCIYRRLSDVKNLESRMSGVRYCGHEDAHFHLMPFDFEGFSEDAKTVISLVLDSPAELMAMAEGKGGQPRNWRSTIRTHLQDIGWAASRIAASFEEIREAV